MRETSHRELGAKRYLGLELSGAKNPKTAVAALEYYPKERKIFLLDIYERIAADEEASQTSDEALLEVLGELRPRVARLGVNVPLELPPCLTCERKSCPLPSKCSVTSVKWMRETARKASKRKDVRVLEFTPYTQRPVELWLRYHVMPGIPEAARFEIDETLGGNRAPLTARMHFLKRHLAGIELVEVLPKLTVALLSEGLGLSKRVVSSYRRLEEGAHARSEILEALSRTRGVFIYERDMRKLSHSLSAFDAFVCAYTALLSDTGGCAKIPAGFPASTGWIEHPALR